MMKSKKQHLFLRVPFPGGLSNGVATTLASVVALLLLFSTTSYTQSPTTIQVRADRQQILIGEPIQLTLQADIPETAPIRFFRIDTLPHFEILNRGKIDTSNTGEGTRLLQQISITSFDSGSWVLPPLPLGDSLFSDSIPVEVGYSPFSPDQPYHDIKDIISEKPKEEESTPWWWYAAGAALVILLVFLYVFTRKKSPPPPAPVVQRDPYAEALQALVPLRSYTGDGKEWFTQLVDIFRLYADERKGIRSLQQTSEDLIRQLDSQSMSAETYQRLAQALRLSDFVKFARYQPETGDREQAWQAIDRAIRELEGKME